MSLRKREIKEIHCTPVLVDVESARLPPYSSSSASGTRVVSELVIPLSVSLTPHMLLVRLPCPPVGKSISQIREEGFLYNLHNIVFVLIWLTVNQFLHQTICPSIY